MKWHTSNLQSIRAKHFCKRSFLHVIYLWTSPLSTIFHPSLTFDPNVTSLHHWFWLVGCRMHFGWLLFRDSISGKPSGFQFIKQLQYKVDFHCSGSLYLRKVFRNKQYFSLEEKHSETHVKNWALLHFSFYLKVEAQIRKSMLEGNKWESRSPFNSKILMLPRNTSILSGTNRPIPQMPQQHAVSIVSKNVQKHYQVKIVSNEFFFEILRFLLCNLF